MMSSSPQQEQAATMMVTTCCSSEDDDFVNESLSPQHPRQQQQQPAEEEEKDVGSWEYDIETTTTDADLDSSCTVSSVQIQFSPTDQRQQQQQTTFFPCSPTSCSANSCSSGNSPRRKHQPQQGAAPATPDSHANSTTTSVLESTTAWLSRSLSMETGVAAACHAQTSIAVTTSTLAATTAVAALNPSNHNVVVCGGGELSGQLLMDHTESYCSEGGTASSGGKDDDDSSSVSSQGSVPYYEPADFNPSNWMRAMDAPTVGFAVLGLAVALTHPILFVVGLATAFGTATAAARGYDYFRDGTACAEWSAWLLNSSTTTLQPTDGETNNDANTAIDDAHSTAPSTFSKANTALVLSSTKQHILAGANNSTRRKQQHASKKKKDSSIVDAAEGDDDDALTTASTSSSTRHDDDDTLAQNLVVGRRRLAPNSAPAALPVPASHRHHHHHRRHSHSHSHHKKHSGSSTVATTLTVPLEQYYPPLAKQVVTDQELVGLNAVEVFTVFFDDAAPYNFKEFQKKRGDIDINYGPWEDVVVDTEEPLSMHPAAAAAADDDDNPNNKRLLQLPHKYHSYQTRTLHFQAKTNNGFMGPAYACTTKTQRCFILSKRQAVLEMKTCLSNIPFSSTFHVMERWWWHSTKLPDKGCYTTALTVEMGVLFDPTKHCPFEGAIRSKSAAAVADVVQAWCRMATQALELTLRAKMDRLAHEHDDDDEEEGEDEHDGDEQQQPSPPRSKTKQQHQLEDIEVRFSNEEGRFVVDGEDETVLRLASDSLRQGAGGGEDESSSRRTASTTRRQPLASLRRSFSQLLVGGSGNSNNNNNNNNTRSSSLHQRSILEAQ